MLINNALVLGTFSRNNKNIRRSEKCIQTTSSGKRINKAADDAAGLGITESFKSQVRGLSQGARNTQDGLSLLQVVDSHMENIETDLLRMKELAVQMNNGTYLDEDRKNADKEFQQLKKDIEYISENAEFNGRKLLKEDKVLSIQVRYEPFMVEEIKLSKIDLDTLKLTGKEITSQEKCAELISTLDDVLENTIYKREELGSLANKFQLLMDDTFNANENTTSALSRIEDVDMAIAAMDSCKNNLLVQYTNAMMAHANRDTNNTIELLK